MADRIILRTRNPNALQSQSVTGGIDQVRFRVNPSSVAVSQSSLSSIRKAQLGYIKTYQGEGLFNLKFNGVVNVHPTESDLNDLETFSEEIPNHVSFEIVKKSSGWSWFQLFSKFVRVSQPFLFELHYLGTPLMLSQENPVFVGDCDPVSFGQDSESPFGISYSFIFNGVLLSDDVDLNYSSLALAKQRIFL